MILVTALFLYLIVITTVSTALGVTQIDIPNSFSVPEPSGSGGLLGGFIDAIKAVALPLLYVFAAIGVFFQLLTFQTAGIPPLVNTFMILPVLAGFFYLLIKLIRGGG